ncbi:MAG: hypothetical protein E7165_02075 [Firmicutes bacterium]|nr:hypothetical protein [Bacillota bacterium]
MENRTNKLIKFSEDEKYFILKQAIFKANNYYLTVKITPDGKEFTNEFAVLQEKERDGKLYFSRVNDPKTLGILLKYLDDRDDSER